MKKSIVISAIVSLISIMSTSSAQGELIDGRFTVLDTTTNYEWQKHPFVYTNWYDGKDQCEDLVMDGHDDWVMPMPGHLRTIKGVIQYLAYNYMYYHTIKEYSATADYSYNIDTGVVGVVSKYNLGNVRCMRDASADMAEVITSVTIQKTGYYTMATSIANVTGMVSAFVDGVLVASYNTDYINTPVGIGNLTAGQNLEVTVNGDKAEGINEIDWQSWDMTFSAGDIEIYVEDPPVPNNCVAAEPTEELPPPVIVEVGITKAQVLNSKNKSTLTLVLNVPEQITMGDGPADFTFFVYKNGSDVAYVGSTVMTHKGNGNIISNK
jgi:hypothetical protein